MLALWLTVLVGFYVKLALVFHAIDVLKEEEEEEENVIFVSNNIYNYVTMNVTETSWFDN